MENSKSQQVERANTPGVASEVLRILRCLTCQGKLREDNEALVCMECGRSYPFVNGIYRFVDAQHYAGSFGFQWHVHSQTQLDTEQSRRSEGAFRRRTGFRPEDLAG